MNNKILLLRNFSENAYITQRQLSAAMEVSLGTVNKLIADSEAAGLIERIELNSRPGYAITDIGRELLKGYKVDRAVIFSAGVGSRFVPITWDTPKGLLRVFGEPMIERQIKQLHAVGITDITVMTGYMREKFEYLKEKYGVELRYNPEYDCKNTLSTLHCARDLFMGHNTYLLYSDNWLRKNMFHEYEPDAWYTAVFREGKTSEWPFRFDSKNRIIDVLEGGCDEWIMFGPVYFSREFSEVFLPVCEQYYNLPATEGDYIEQVYLDWIHGSNRILPLKAKDCPPLFINKQPADQVHEFDSLEEMKELDDYYASASVNEALSIISKTFTVPVSDIKNIRDMKVGLTNHSFFFTIHQKPYICRVPWDLTNEVMDRKREQAVFDAVAPLGINQNVVYHDEAGYMIVEYFANTRTADIHNDSDVKVMMDILHRLHNAGLKVEYDCDFRKLLQMEEEFCLKSCPVPMEDYGAVKKNILELIDKTEVMKRKKTLIHFDPNERNFLFLQDTGEVKLIDWEYSGMGDPLMELSSMANYSYLDKAGLDHLIDMYYGADRASEKERGLAYAYMAILSLCWALWGFRAVHDTGKYEDYTAIQYEYARTFYREAITRLP